MKTPLQSASLEHVVYLTMIGVGNSGEVSRENVKNVLGSSLVYSDVGGGCIPK